MLKSAPTKDATKPEREVQILCSRCFDEIGENVLAIIPQSTCAICEKKCLGYETKREVR